MTGAGGPDRDQPIAWLRNGSPVGAWLLKANPQVWDVIGALEQGEGLERWRLAWSYRVELVDVNHPVVLWVTGASSARHLAGIWAVGTITARPEAMPDDPNDPGWGDEAGPFDTRPYVAVDLRVLPDVVTRQELASDPRFAESEILTSPRMGSPLALTPLEWATVRTLIDDPTAS